MRTPLYTTYTMSCGRYERGIDVHSLMQDIELPAELEVGQGYGKVSWGVRAIWQNYAGWFHHRSTTELYSLPQSSIHAELVDMLGASALVDRARQNMDSGKSRHSLRWGPPSALPR